jgi:hypothetical protein
VRKRRKKPVEGGHRMKWFAKEAALALIGLAASSVALAAPSQHATSPVDGGGQGGTFSYTIVPTTPLVQYTPVLFQGPYFYFTITNTGTQTDTYRLILDNLSNGGWFPQVCIDQTCFPDSLDLTLNPGQQQQHVGANIVPFSDGMSTGDFHVRSLGNPNLTSFYQVTLWAGSGTGVPEGMKASGLLLEQNAPNPVSNSTSIAFSLLSPSDVSLDIFDVSGRLVRKLTSGPREAGSHQVSWNGLDDSGSRLANGVYYYRLSTSTGVATKSLTLVQ